MRTPIAAIFWVAPLLVLACASERGGSSRPPPPPPMLTSTATPAATAVQPTAPPTVAAPAPAQASADPPALDAAPADGGSVAAVDAAPAVDRKRCPLFPPSGGTRSWRAVPELTGLSEAELGACYGEPVDKTGDKRVFHFPRGCTDQRAELELTLRNGRASKARVRSRFTGQHCVWTD